MKINVVLKWYLFITCVYLIGDGLIHVFDFKLMDITNWSKPSYIYSKYVGNLFGLFAILAASFGIEVSRNLNKYKNFLYIGATWSLVYGGYLVYSSLVINFTEVFNKTPSVYFWLPFYNYYLIFEAGLLFILSTLIYFYLKKHG